MCGLFGVISKYPLTHGEKSAAKELAIISALRGTDSTGIISLRRDTTNRKVTKLKITKRAFNSSSFVDDVKCSAAFEGCYGIIGHTRHATVGMVNWDNAQPIHADRIMGCHNGTVPSFAKQIKDEKTESDSKLLMKFLHDYGLQQTVDEAREGAYALTYVDLDTNTFNVIRNSKRTLYYMHNHYNNIMFWASEAAMLELVADRNNMNQFTQPKPFTTHTLFQYNLGDLNFKQPKTSMVPPKHEQKHHWFDDYSKGKEQEVKTSVPQTLSKNQIKKRKKKAEKEKRLKESKLTKGLEFEFNSKLKQMEYFDPLTGDMLYYRKNGTLHDCAPIDFLKPQAAYKINEWEEQLDFEWEPSLYDIVDDDGTEFQMHDVRMRCEEGCAMCGSELEPTKEDIYMCQENVISCSDCKDDPFLAEYVNTPFQLLTFQRRSS